MLCGCFVMGLVFILVALIHYVRDKGFSFLMVLMVETEIITVLTCWRLCGKRNFGRRRRLSLSAFFYHVGGAGV